jgi:hypothetical protein
MSMLMSMSTPMTLRRLLLALPLLLLLPATSAFANSSEDRVGVGQDISIAEGDTANDIACAFCSVHIHGDVKGDVAVLFGTVSVDSGHSISGDVAILGGDLNLASSSNVGGDVAIAAGDLNASPDATIRGDRAIFPGRFWLLIPFAPLLILIGVIWLIVYLVRRNRYRFPVYPNGRGL